MIPVDKKWHLQKISPQQPLQSLIEIDAIFQLELELVLIPSFTAAASDSW